MFTHNGLPNQAYMLFDDVECEYSETGLNTDHVPRRCEARHACAARAVKAGVGVCGTENLVVQMYCASWAPVVRCPAPDARCPADLGT